MAQHLLLADIAVPFLLAGLRTPVLVHYLPRPVLVPLAHRHTLAAHLPLPAPALVSIPVYLVILYTWHFSFAFEAALRHPLIHVLQPHLVRVRGGPDLVVARSSPSAGGCAASSGRSPTSSPRGW